MNIKNIDMDKIDWKIISSVGEAKELSDDELMKIKFENKETTETLEKKDNTVAKNVLESMDSFKNEHSVIKKNQDNNLEIDLLKKQKIEEEAAIMQMYGTDNFNIEDTYLKNYNLKKDIQKLEKTRNDLININQSLNKEGEILKDNINNLNKKYEIIKNNFNKLSIDLFNLNNTFLSMQNDLNSI